MASKRSTTRRPNGAAGSGRERAKQNPKRLTPVRTIDDVLQSDEFREHALFPLLQSSHYFASLVDSRSLLKFDQADPATLERVHAMASALKAALQWFTTDERKPPEFVKAARAYLAKGPQLELVDLGPPPTPGRVQHFHTGIVAPRKGAMTEEGRLAGLLGIRRSVTRMLMQAERGEFEEHPRLFRMMRAGELSPRQLRDRHPHGILPQRLAAHLYLAFIAPGSPCTELLRGTNMDPDLDPLRIGDVVANELLDADVWADTERARRSRCERLAERLIREALKAIGAVVDKHLFRDRRG